MRHHYRVLVLIGFCVCAILLPTLAPPTHAQDGGGWRVEAAQPLTELFRDTRAAPERVFPAPTGDRIAYESQNDNGERGLCVFVLATRDQQCTYFPRETAYTFPVQGFFAPLAWSPDGTQIALVGMPYHLYRDTDLGLLRDGVFVPLIDDGYADKLMGGKPTTLTYSVEIQPTFSPDGTKIAVEQTLILPEGGTRTTTISLVDAATGDIEVLLPVPSDDPSAALGTVISMGWSPDGTQLAFSVMPFHRDDTHNGVWRLDIASGDLTQLLTLDDGRAAIQQVYPDYEDVLAVGPLQWSPDGTRLLFWSGDIGAYNGVIWCFWLNLASGDIHPVPLPTHPRDAGGFRAIWPQQAVWSPDGETLLVLAQNSYPSFDDAPMLVESDEVPRYHVYLIDLADETATLLGGLPYEPSPAFTAAWGPENDVIIGNVYLKLARD